MSRSRPVMVLAVLALLPALAACTGSDGSTVTSPSSSAAAPVTVPTSAGVQDACAAMSLDSIRIATGRSGLTAAGEFRVTTDGKHIGSCLVADGSVKVVSVTIAPADVDPTLAARVRTIVSAATAPVILPASAGTGFAQPESTTEDGVTVAGAKALLLVDDTLLGITVIHPAAGRDANQDAAALVQQVASSLKLKP